MIIDPNLYPGTPFPDRPAPECDDQLPLIARAGRGLRGDGYLVRIKQDSDCETYLEGLKYDAASNTYSSDWVSENVNGGKIMYQYNLRPYTNPQTFTITFRVKRPNRPEWQWTTPAIPYIWDADDDGKADVDKIVGTGVADFFLKKTTESTWDYPTVTHSQYAQGLMTALKHDKLVYPDEWTREMFNAPSPGDPWSVNIQYGIGGDLDAPNIDDIAKLLGITVQQVRNIINGQHGQFAGDGITGDNVKGYIDDLNAHIHNDMGFGHHLIGDDDDVARNTIKKYIDGLRADLYKNLGVTDPSGNFYNVTNDLSLAYTQKHGGNKGKTTTHPTIKAYIDARCDDIEEGLAEAKSAVKDGLQNLVNKIYGGGTVNDDGTITWPSDSPLAHSGKIAVGNINVLSSSTSNAIVTHSGTATGDLKGE